jgi:hypothetical protein
MTTEHDAAREVLCELDGLKIEDNPNRKLYDVDAAIERERVAILQRYAARLRAEALRDALDALRSYFPDSEPQTIRLCYDCTIEVNGDSGDLIFRGGDDGGNMSGQEFFAHVEHGLRKLRKHLAAKLEGGPDGQV